MRRLLALVLYIGIGLPAILGSLFLIPMSSWVLDRDFYKRIVSGPEIEAVLESPALYEGFQGSFTMDSGLALEGQAAGKALEASLPVPEILSEAEGLVDSAFNSLDADMRKGRFHVDLRGLKSILLRGVPGFARVYSLEVPVGEPTLTSPPPASETALDLSVRPASLSESDFSRILETALNSALAQVPDIAEGELPAPPASASNASSPRDALTRGILLLALLGGGIWVAGAFISTDSMSRRLAWWGTTLIIPGAVVLAAGAIVRFAADPLVLGSIQDPELQRFLSDPSLAIVRNWIHLPFWRISRGFLISGSAALILGGGISASRKALAYRDLA